MSGPEHFAEAERLIGAITKPDALLPTSRVLLPGDHGDVLALAQIHATLSGVYAHNRATTELTGLLHVMFDQIREAREAAS
jgi:hypothetical protein